MFLATQACTNFINECMHEPSYDVFSSMKKLLKRKIDIHSFLRFCKPATPFLKNKTFAVNKTVVCAMPDTAGLDEIMEAEAMEYQTEEEEEKGSLAMGDDNPQQNAPKKHGWMRTMLKLKDKRLRQNNSQRRNSFRTQSFPALRPRYFIEPRPMPALPDDSGDSLPAARATYREDQ